MPRPSFAGFVIGAFSFIFGFAMVWHIWWLAILSGLLIFLTVVARTFDNRAEIVIPARDVAHMEAAQGAVA
jgi:cytochrome o ubiquinol oxidase subunit I